MLKENAKEISVALIKIMKIKKEALKDQKKLKKSKKNLILWTKTGKISS
jgi:hypothetical protein